MNDRRRLLLFAALLVLLSFAVPLLAIRQTLGHDWDYFNGLSWMVRTNLLFEHTLALHDPWRCSGLDLLANPQARIFSPLGLLDLLLPPHAANLASLMLHALFGMIGAAALFRRLGANQWAALCCAFLFVDGSWFTLHFAEGHIPFGAIQLLPWAALFALDIAAPRAQVGLCALLVLMAWDGGIYALVFTVYLVATLWLCGVEGAGRAAARTLVDRETWPRLVRLFAALATGLAAKLVPALVAGTRTAAQEETVRMDATLALRALFDPRQVSEERALIGRLRFHELGCYIGVPLALLVVWFLSWFLWRHGDARRRLFGLLVAIALWLWVGLGLGGAFNPWRLHAMVPLLNVAHVQTRVLVLVFLLVLCIAALALTALSPRAFFAVAGLLLVESVSVRTYAWQRAYQASAHAPPPAGPIAKHTLARTVAYQALPRIYQTEGTASRGCYEPSVPAAQRIGTVTGEPNDHGEAFFFVPEIGPPTHTADGAVSILSYRPGELRARFRVAGEEIIVFNTRHLGGWRARGAEVVSRPGDRLAVAVAPGEGELILRYSPGYRAVQLLFILSSLALFLATGLATLLFATLRTLR